MASDTSESNGGAGLPESGSSPAGKGARSGRQVEPLEPAQQQIALRGAHLQFGMAHETDFNFGGLESLPKHLLGFDGAFDSFQEESAEQCGIATSDEPSSGGRQEDAVIVHDGQPERDQIHQTPTGLRNERDTGEAFHEFPYARVEQWVVVHHLGHRPECLDIVAAVFSGNLGESISGFPRGVSQPDRVGLGRFDALQGGHVVFVELLFQREDVD